MLDERQCAKLIDFGLSKEMEDLQASKASTHFAGTQNWISPEKRAGRPSTGASDVYSLGLVVMNVLTLQTPPPSQPERERAAQELDYRRIGLDNDIACRLVARCIHENPLNRPTSATVATSLVIHLDLCRPSSHVSVFMQLYMYMSKILRVCMCVTYTSHEFFYACVYVNVL